MIRFNLARAGLALAALLALLPAARAHVVLEQGEAKAGIYFRASFMVGHGCDGSPTRRVTVYLPSGVWVAKPQPKPGWSIETRVERLPAPVTVHGKPQQDAVSQVSWTGGPLPDDQFETFGLMIRVPDAAGTVPIRVLQECVAGQADWSQPRGKGVRYPAPVLKVLPVDEHAGH